MGYTLKTNIANKANYGSKRKTSTIKYIVVHYTANDGDTDEANAKYFKNNIVKASAHYFVDDDSITQSVPDDYVAYSVGGTKYANTKGASFYGKCTNANSLSFELCDTKKNGKYDFTDATINNAVDMIKKKMKEYNVTIDRVIRHYDVTGKICPKPFVDDESKWKSFKNKLTTISTTKETTSTINYKVKVTAKVLNVRAGAGTNYKVNTTIKKDEVYTIVEEKKNRTTTWGKLKSGAGWISLSYCKKV